jgi:hypothetical protein
VPRCSRYLVDLNRPSDNRPMYPGQNNTELCPTRHFTGEPIYREGQAPDDAEIQRRVRSHWQPYHDTLQAELAELRRIQGIVRLGHVKAIDADQIHLDQGSIPMRPDTLVVDCSAAGIPSVETVPVWAGNRITPQWLSSFGTVFSASFIAHVEATFDDEAEKNALCTPMSPPTLATDWLRMLHVTMNNRHLWSRHPELQQWLAASRLNSMFHSAGRIRPDETEKIALMQRYRQAIKPAVARLPKLMATLA